MWGPVEILKLCALKFRPYPPLDNRALNFCPPPRKLCTQISPPPSRCPNTYMYICWYDAIQGSLESLDPGPGLWTPKICCTHVLILDLCVSCLWVFDSSDKSTCTIPKKSLLNPKSWGLKHTSPKSKDVVCFWAEISVQSPAFPGPKHKSRVQRFQNAQISSNVLLDL